MKAANKIVRDRKLSNEDKIARLGTECGIPNDSAQKLLQPDFAGRIGFARDQIQRIAAQYRSILLRSGGTDVCEPRTEPDPGPPHQNWRRCYVTIEVTPYTSNGFEYCLARLPERIEFNDSDKKKLIVFELKPTVQGSGPYRFDDQVGIRLFTNAGGAVVKGKFGNGDNGSDTPSQFHVKNSHGVRGEALYLPVILQVNSNDEPLSVCAAADPKIVNN